MTAVAISLDTIREARARIAPYVPVTPIVAMAPSGLMIKAESLQPTGAFKIRGAFNALLSLSEAERRRGVVAHSSGNHAQALAYAAARLGIRATVVIPETAAAMKIDATRRLGANVILVSPLGRHRFEACDRIVRDEGATLVPPFDSYAIMAATGTIALEILEQVPNVACVVAPVAGGGLVGGIAAAMAHARPGVRVVGAEPALADDAAQSFRAGHIVEIEAQQALRTIADGLRTARLGEKTWPVIQACVHDIVPIAEYDICDAVRAIFREARLVAEPSGAVAVAGALACGMDPRRTVAVLSGGNVAASDFCALLSD
jgi:threonine dehydratase